MMHETPHEHQKRNQQPGSAWTSSLFASVSAAFFSSDLSRSSRNLSWEVARTIRSHDSETLNCKSGVLMDLHLGVFLEEAFQQAILTGDGR